MDPETPYCGREERDGVDVRFWLASYALYLLAVFFPQSSTFRLLVPMFPLLGVVAQPRLPRSTGSGSCSCSSRAQVGWIYIVLVASTDTTGRRRDPPRLDGRSTAISLGYGG